MTSCMTSPMSGLVWGNALKIHLYHTSYSDVGLLKQLK